MHVTPPPLDLKRFVWRPGTCRGRCLTKQYVLCLWHHCLDPNWKRTSPFCLQYCLKSSLLFSCKLFFATFAHRQCLSNELVDLFKVLFGQPVSVRAENARSAVVVCLRLNPRNIALHLTDASLEAMWKTTFLPNKLSRESSRYGSPIRISKENHFDDSCILQIQ